LAAGVKLLFLKIFLTTGKRGNIGLRLSTVFGIRILLTLLGTYLSDLLVQTYFLAAIKILSVLGLGKNFNFRENVSFSRQFQHA
jgi:hypothetical protein